MNIWVIYGLAKYYKNKALEGALFFYDFTDQSSTGTSKLIIKFLSDFL